jgi:hypothetical protein
MAYVPPGYDAVELLTDLFASAWDREPLDPVVAAWLQRGILEAVRRNETLDQALGLSGRGMESLQARLLRMQRNRHLARARDVVALEDSVKAWARCCRLAPLVKAFMCDTWPSARRLLDPPADWPAWKRSVFRAAQTGLELPRTARGLYGALNEIPPFSLHCEHEIVLSDYL